MNVGYSGSPSSRPTFGQWLRALYRFSRPESTLGSAVMSIGISVALLPAVPYQPIVFAKIFSCILTLCLWTVASHGVNQIYDLPVDRINKPDFPLPSGVMTERQAWIVSVGSGVVGSLLALWAMPLWLAVSFIGFMTWASAVYSVPRFGSRTVRQSPLLPKLLTICFRAIVYPTTAFLTVRDLAPEQSLGLVYLVFILTFALFFCVGMNTFEDIPDMKGDREGGYRSYALALGATKTAYISFAAFVTAFLGLAVWIYAFPYLFRVQPGLAVEALLLFTFVARFIQLLRSQLQADGSGAKPFYIFLWRLYAFQYITLIVIFSPTQFLLA